MVERDNNEVVTQKDLFYLLSLMEGIRCNLGLSFTFYFKTMDSTKMGALCGGSYVTRLAKNLGVFRWLSNLTVEPKMIPLNMDVM